MNRIFSLCVYLTISVISLAQDKTVSSAAAPENPHGFSMAETKAWVERELPQLGSFSIVTAQNDDRSNLSTSQYKNESAFLLDGRLSIHRTVEMRATSGLHYTMAFTETVTLKDVDVSKVQAGEYPVTAGFTSSRPRYTVRLIAAADRGKPFARQTKQEGLPAREVPITEVNVNVQDEDSANRVADVLRQAAILCGAPDHAVDTAVAGPGRKAGISSTRPTPPASTKMKNDDVIQLVTAGLSEHTSRRGHV